MAIQIETKGLSNGKTLVQSYNSLTGYEKYDLKSYSVSDDKKDEFVKSIKRHETNGQYITALSALIGLGLGAVCGYKYPVSRIDIKPYVSFYSALAGFVAGAFGGKLYNNLQVSKIVNNFGAEKL